MKLYVNFINNIDFEIAKIRIFSTFFYIQRSKNINWVAPSLEQLKFYTANLFQDCKNGGIHDILETMDTWSLFDWEESRAYHSRAIA